METQKAHNQYKTKQKQKTTISRNTNQSLNNSNRQSRLSRVRKSKKLLRHNKYFIAYKRSIQNRKPCNTNCRSHQFQIKPIGMPNILSRSTAEPVNMNFCFSKSNSSTNPIPTIPKQFSKQPHIPVFILDEDRIKYETHMSLHRQQLQQAITKGNKLVDDEQDQQILIAIPKTKNCQVCRVKIDDQQQYLRHIGSYDHKVSINKSLGHKLILEQILSFREQQKYDNQINIRLKQFQQLSLILKESKRMLKGILSKR